MESEITEVLRESEYHVIGLKTRSLWVTLTSTLFKYLGGKTKHKDKKIISDKNGQNASVCLVSQISYSFFLQLIALLATNTEKKINYLLA